MSLDVEAALLQRMDDCRQAPPDCNLSPLAFVPDEGQLSAQPEARWHQACPGDYDV